jgi:hypothetical protein
MAVLERPCCLSVGEDWTAGVSLGVLLTTQWWWPIVGTIPYVGASGGGALDFFSMFGGQKISPFHFLSLVFSAGRGGVPAEIGLKFSPPKFRIYLDQI